MNVKEGFRYQNKINTLFKVASGILSDERSLLNRKVITLRSKVDPNAEDTVNEDLNNTIYAESISDIVDFVNFLISEREKLSAAIHKVKETLPIDIDSETAMNSMRQDLAKVYREMLKQRERDFIIPGHGIAYRWNQEGNQVQYTCDLHEIDTLNYDKADIKRKATALNKQIDEVSANIDKALINYDLDYEPPFDVNDTFDDIFDDFISKQINESKNEGETK